MENNMKMPKMSRTESSYLAPKNSDKPSNTMHFILIMGE